MGGPGKVDGGLVEKPVSLSKVAKEDSPQKAGLSLGSYIDHELDTHMSGPRGSKEGAAFYRYVQGQVTLANKYVKEPETYIFSPLGVSVTVTPEKDEKGHLTGKLVGVVTYKGKETLPSVDKAVEKYLQQKLDKILAGLDSTNADQAKAGISKQVTDGQILPVEVNFSVAGNSKINLK